MTEKKEILLDKAYKEVLDLMLEDSPLELVETLVVDDIMGFGTTMDEVIFGKNQFLKLLKDQREQGSGFELNIDVSPVNRQMSSDGNVAIIANEMKISMQLDADLNEFVARGSMIFEFFDGAWKMIHWHGSKAVETKGDTWHKEEWKQLNEKLQKQVEEKTEDLALKNRELEIEASLERIRAIAMSMQKAEGLLDVAEILFKELKALGFTDIRNTIINILDDTREKFLNYDYSDYGIGGIDEVDYNSHPSNKELVNRIREASKEFMITEFTGNELDEWRKWRIKQGQMPDLKLDQAESLYYYEFFIGVGSIGISTFSPISADQLKILNKIRNVFDLAYRRYTDITQAEARAKEAKIEVALERVRTIAMGMQKPDDMLNVCQIISEQLELLNVVDIRNIQVAIVNESKKTYLNYQYFTAYSKQVFEETEYENNPASKAMVGEMQKSANSFYEGSIKDKALQEFRDWRKRYNQYPDPLLDKSSTVHYYFYSIGNGGLGLTTYKKISQSSLQIFKRFHKVFKLAYQRFIDIDKAETQAREAQIELALERVRARSMAMHKSEELADLSLELVKQVQTLGVETWFCAFNIYDEDQKGSLEWGSNGEGTFPKYRTPREGIFLRYYEIGQSGESFLINEIGENECPAHYDYLCSLPGVGEQLLKMKDAGIPFPTSQIDHVAYFKYGYILFITFEPAPEAHDIFIRFAKVFEQTYTRFLDLQKAEAQAREAQIEAALERVRARSMAMHKSEELSETASVLFQELQSLEKIPDRLGITTYDEESKVFNNWVTDQTGLQLTNAFIASINEPTTFNKIFRAWEKNKESLIIELTGNELEEWLLYVREKLKLPINESQIRNRRIHYVAFYSYGFLMCTFHEPLKNNFIDLLTRFAKVFEQTYTRFLDIQKAEEQTREAQIEMALERVRSKTMAMHRSDELADTATHLFEQLNTLGIKPYRCNIAIVDAKKDGCQLWSTTNKGKVIPTSAFIPLTENFVFKKMYQGWKNKTAFLVIKLIGEKRAKWTKYMSKYVSFSEYQKGKVNEDKLLNEAAIFSNISFKQGFFTIHTTEELNVADQKVIQRFANVFEQTYTRFLDLKKAEAQAKEAQIELSLERIRAQVTAMKESAELLDIVVTMRTEFVSLGHEAHFFWYMRWLPEKYEKAMTSGDGSRIGMVMHLPRHIHGDIKLVDDWEKSDEPTVVFPMDVETAVDYVDKMIKLGDFVQVDPNAPTLDDVRHIGGLTFIMARTHHGEIGFSIPGSVPDPPQDSVNTLARFAGVFDLAYSRFEDLKDAEQRNRETQIELALERVRARTMAMHQTSELQDVINTLHQQFSNLNMNITGGAFIAINSDIEKEINCWGAGETADYIQRVHIPFFNRPIYTDIVKGIKKSQGFLSEEYTNDEKIEFFKHLFKNPPYNKAPATVKKEVFRREGGYTRSCVVSNYTSIFIINHHGRVFTDEENDILKRFGNVFEQTYTRFLDLQKAEAQAREAQIEASLERIRSRALSMHNSSEVGDVNDVLFDEFEKMGIEMVGCGISVVDENTDHCEQWRAKQIAAVNSFEPYSYKESIRILSEYMPDFLLEFLRAWKEGDLFLTKYLEGKERDAYLMAVATIFNYSKSQQTEILAAYPKSFNANFVFYKRGWLSLSTLKRLTDEEINFSRRFVEAFDFAHTRFLDLQKAEAQAREAQIEAALERVRSKTMAMHNSDDMAITVTTLFEQVLKLELDNDIRCGIGILEGTQRMETRSATLDAYGEVDLKMGMLDMSVDPMLKRIKKAWKSGGTHYKDQMAGKQVIKYYSALNNEPDYPFYVDLDTLPKKQYHNSFSFSEGILFAFSPNPMTEEAAKVMDRFARVFGQTYTRFVDLQKAEAQAREAQIEAALERIRTQAMAMQHSDDLINSTAILFEELEKLELSLERCGIGIFDKETRECQLYTTVVNDEGKTELATGITSLTVHPMLIKTFDAWKAQESLLYVLEGNELEDYYKLVSKSKFHLPEDVINKSASLAKEYYFYTPFGAGGLYVFSDIEPLNEEIKVIRRFAEVFHMTYTRYEDLQKAEARALEAVKQASLDRVRGEIASMRTSEDLNRITPLIWSELEILEVPFIRCGAFIIDESNSSVQAHLTTSDGKPVGVLNLPFDANDLTYNTVEHWRKKKVYIHHWNKEDFVNWMKSMISLGQIQTTEQYQGSEKPPESLDLHFIPFKQGMLYVGNTTPLLPEKIEMVKTLAKAFSIAYARFEDFVNLEEAKTRIEKTLSELKSAQTQLIHSEKMASLGELTAGIAHEIQNPLNFVNNFSEVSVDLMEELDEELADGSMEDVKDIGNDIRQNLQKIHHHGQRASSIVKGMLEHSRVGDSQKVNTEINALADEFLRLAYHGLRAKDKSFNADFKTDFDETLTKVKVVPQDFGRVLLNLINNAFYAVSAETSAKADPDYKPLVVVCTKNLGDKVEIRVSDNGNGIPADVKDKIFQPFFTTKPTGEGTGLGLSMSFDIITKGHGGELKVESKEGKGTEFIIIIPQT